MRFRIWYDDGSVIAGEGEEEWDAAPRHGVLTVHVPGLIHQGLDYYWYESDQVKSCNRMDIDRYLVRPRGVRCVKFGRWADDYIWQNAEKELKEFLK